MNANNNGVEAVAMTEIGRKTSSLVGVFTMFFSIDVNCDQDKLRKYICVEKDIYPDLNAQPRAREERC